MQQSTIRTSIALILVTLATFTSGCKVEPQHGTRGGMYGSTTASHGIRKVRHRGIDYRGFQGQAVIATADGTVTMIRRETAERNKAGPNSGNTVEIMHPTELPDGARYLFTKYAHLSKIKVRLGQTVKRGQIIGTMGTTGCVRFQCGPHVHFEVHPWMPANHQNPAKFIAGCDDPLSPPTFAGERVLVYPIEC